MSVKVLSVKIGKNGVWEKNLKVFDIFLISIMGASLLWRP